MLFWDQFDNDDFFFSRRFLFEVQLHSKVNKMNVENLATVMGINLLKPQIEDPITVMKGKNVLLMCPQSTRSHICVFSWRWNTAVKLCPALGKHPKTNVWFYEKIIKTWGNAATWLHPSLFRHWIYWHNSILQKYLTTWKGESHLDTLVICGRGRRRRSKTTAYVIKFKNFTYL